MGATRAILIGGVLACAAGVALPPASTSHPEILALEPDPVADELDRRWMGDVLPLVREFCLDCHHGDDPSGDVSLDAIRGVQSALKEGPELRLLREMITTGAMPPKRKPQPTEHQRLTMVQWIDAALAYIPPDAAVDPGWFTTHRLNRNEYRNTLRDLLGLDHAREDLAARLPQDDTGYGFDNIADVLSVSPVAVEQYLAAAERAIELALGPIVEVGDHPRKLRPIEGRNGQRLPSGGFLLFSNGPVTATFTAPLEGEYIARLRAWETPAGDDRSHMSVRLGRRSIGEFTVIGNRDDPQDFEIRFRCTPGQQTIAAHFTNDFYIPNTADRNLAVETISISGPIDEATTNRPRAFDEIFRVGAHLSDERERAAAVLNAFASRAYRRPATQEQVASLVGLYDAQRVAGEGFDQAVRTSLAAVLVSPSFLFRTAAHPDAANPDARYTLDGYELASRLSFFLWSSMPDEALLAAAADGSILTDDGLVSHIRRMIADPKSRAFIENFAGQWLQLRALPGLAIDQSRFPEFDESLRADMLREATLFFADVLLSNRSVLDLIDSRDSFLNERLARHYGLPPIQGSEFRKVVWPDESPRGGILTMGAVLTLTSNTTRTSPVRRGLFVLDQILGAPPPPPPADIPPLEQATVLRADATVREQLAAHTTNASCAVCHNRLDPIGLTFENFDAIGRWRTEEGGRPIDSSGKLPGGEVMSGPRDLKQSLLERSDQFVEALSGKVLMYAIGRGLEPFDRPAIRRIAQRTRAGDDRFQTLIESIVLSETFRTCRGRKPAHE